ncbi:BTAD domain-containing putative transcriptional regulator [Actinoplanes sichuanensis]|uniref:BTAD domain-containing putative transcriptional regulator n=1 Tax=Actinoplanes sichuanensis TaxID=512349 RepID=A0ABW4AQ31_9ACTN|nr:BTAD domain-containing putative transcriptional regulator [Actinoplanes sichuanensis]BEL02951.1 BTAD domain-containing putative transcriptional regulator [Actinoplanes sichuanensis]
MALTFRLLGPVQIVSDRGVVTGVAPRHRAVLAYLLLHAGRVISMDRLIDAMWGYDQPETARSQIHAAVTALRRALRTAGAEGVLETRPGGYTVVPESGRLDVREFDDLVSAGRFREALDLWHGEALADVHGGYVASARALLDDRRLTAVERLMESQLEAGRHAAVVDELAGHVAADPLRERLAGQFVLALHRSGRQADALAAARAYRAALAEEQGLDPGSGFLELEKTVLAGGPPTGRSGFLPYDLPDFAGRGAELDAIRPGFPQNVVTIDGMAGVGKTTLAVRAAHRLADGFPDGQLFVDLRANTAGQDPVAAPAALEILLRQLGVTEIPRTEQERSALWRAETRRRRVLVVIDNAADEAHVRPLLPGASDSLMLITSRRRLIDIDGARAFSVDVLPADDATALFGSIVGERAAAEPDAVREVLDLCGHLPLAIRLAAARLQHRPRWTVAYLAGRLRLADLATAERSVTAAFTVSYEHLAEPEQRMFRLLGLAPGRDIEPQAAAALADLPVIEAEDLLEGLLDTHMLVQREPGRYTMHDLLREHARTLAAEDGAVMRLLVHYLHRSRSAVRQLYPGNIGDRPGLPPVLTPIEPIAGPGEAIGWLDAERGNIIATVVHGPRVCVGHLAHALRPYLDRQAHHDDAVTLHTIALTRGRANGDATVEGHALADLAWTHWRRGDYEQARVFAGQALTVASDEFPRSLAMHALGDVAWRHRETERAESCLKEALDLARVAGDRSREAFVLGDLGMILDRLGRHDEARRHLDLALAMHRKDANPLGEARVLNQIGLLLRHQGRPGEASARHREAGDLYRAMGNRSEGAAAHNGLGEAALATGDPARARTGHETAVALAETAGNRPEQARARYGLARAHLALADWIPAADQALAAERLYHELGVPEAGDARLLVLLARAQRAPDDFEPVRGATEEEIGRLAARYPMPLPLSYVSWLRVCDGATVGPGGIHGIGEVLERLDSCDDWPRQGRIPVAGDGCGNDYVLDTESGAVYFIDAMEGDDYAYRVAGDVQDFVRFLLERDAGQLGGRSTSAM